MSGPIVASAQAPIPRSPVSSITITTLQQEREKFSGILQDGPSKQLYQNAFVIHNGDKRDVVAVYAQWNIVDQAGQTRVFEFMSDIYASLIPSTVILSGKDLIISPNGWVYPHLYHSTSSRMAIESQSSSFKELTSLLAQTTDVSLSIDAVMFGDGEVCGANTKNLGEVLLARKAAAATMSSQIRGYILRNEDWHPYVTSLIRAPGNDDKSTEDFWKKAFALQFSMLSDKERQQSILTYYERLPQPPATHPCRGNGSAP